MKIWLITRRYIFIYFFQLSVENIYFINYCTVLFERYIESLFIYIARKVQQVWLRDGPFIRVKLAYVRWVIDETHKDELSILHCPICFIALVA